MCVLLECCLGDEIVAIENFTAYLSGSNQEPSSFMIGQRVKYLGATDHPNNKNLCMVEFESFGQIYRAMHTLFVPSDTWDELVHYILKNPNPETRPLEAARRTTWTRKK